MNLGRGVAWLNTTTRPAQNPPSLRDHPSLVVVIPYLWAGTVYTTTTPNLIPECCLVLGRAGGGVCTQAPPQQGHAWRPNLEL
jgi:hypothetical protein